LESAWSTSFGRAVAAFGTVPRLVAGGVRALFPPAAARIGFPRRFSYHPHCASNGVGDLPTRVAAVATPAAQSLTRGWEGSAYYPTGEDDSEPCNVSAFARCWWICATAAAPSPMAPPTRLTEPERTSPTAKTPGMLDSSGAGRTPPVEAPNAMPVSTNPCGSTVSSPASGFPDLRPRTGTRYAAPFHHRSRRGDHAMSLLPSRQVCRRAAE